MPFSLQNPTFMGGGLPIITNNASTPTNNTNIVNSKKENEKKFGWREFEENPVRGIFTFVLKTYI